MKTCFCFQISTSRPYQSTGTEIWNEIFRNRRYFKWNFSLKFGQFCLFFYCVSLRKCFAVVIKCNQSSADIKRYSRTMPKILKPLPLFGMRARKLLWNWYKLSWIWLRYMPGQSLNIQRPFTMIPFFS